MFEFRSAAINLSHTKYYMKSTDIHTWKTTVASVVSREDKNSNFRIYD